MRAHILCKNNTILIVCVCVCVVDAQQPEKQNYVLKMVFISVQQRISPAYSNIYIVKSTRKHLTAGKM